MPDGRDWFKANWVFRQLAHDASLRFPDDAEMIEHLGVAQAIGSLNLRDMPTELCERTIEAMVEVIKTTEVGELPGWRSGDQDGREMYLTALSELAALLADQPAQT
jgi:hypothetical protein